ncbi:ABC transporter substrate-binding protein [Paenibacillus sp. CF384]|uniref:ABC transporter substrate-binding protein n=1 Tax=Paenibacillus sp. CF384 TaxID=1884382 RepID=UPI00089B71CD|nr:ABC transporter substrate-binding protein [Paenibacillus sp. CF384]SDX71212.1 iron complex transport system substrate-binding protein [Paenibacillus sp. CF384]
MKRNVRWVRGLIIVLLIMVSTACGATNTSTNKSDTAEENASNTSSTTNTSNTDNAANTSNTGNAAAEETNQQRVVKTLKGDVSIPADPKQVIGLSVVYPEFLYALGVTPIAVQNYHLEFPSYLKDSFKDTLKMGIARTPDFEAILASKPDLIIAPTWWSDKDYGQLSKIAPTVLLPERSNWRDELRDIGEVLGKKEQAEKVITDLQAKEEDAKKKLDELAGDETVLYMEIMDKEIFIYGENSDRGKFVHKGLGLSAIKNFPQSENSLSISLEKIPEYNPDHIILQMSDDANQAVKDRYKEMMDSSLWKNMTAVKNNHVYLMGSKEWFNLGMSPLADSSAIDDVVHAFEGKQ